MMQTVPDQPETPLLQLDGGRGFVFYHPCERLVQNGDRKLGHAVTSILFQKRT